MPSPTSRNQPARATLVGLALAATCALSACATSSDAQTNQIYTAPEGTDVRDGDVKGLNLLVVDNGDGSGTLVAALVNRTDEDDSLVGLTAIDPDADEGASVDISVTGIEAPIELPAGKLVQLADLGPVVLTGEGVAAGQFVDVQLTFTSAGALSASIPVMLREGPYEEVPVPEPAPEAGDPVPEG